MGGRGGGQTVIYKGHLAQMDWWKIDTEFSKIHKHLICTILPIKFSQGKI